MPNRARSAIDGFAGVPLARAWGSVQNGAFTLVELIVVVGIIAVVLAVSLPSVSQMWEERKEADVQNTLKGLLRSARMRALHNTERGLFFFVEGGIQRIAFIEAEPPDPDPTGADVLLNVTEQVAADRFRVVQGNVYDLPPPMRVAPRTALDSSVWDDDELANEDYTALITNRTENHRNFFTLLFSAEGQLIVGRSVFIHDDPGANPNPTGAITLLGVAGTPNYQDQDGTNPPFPGGATLPAMIFARTDMALNFPSVDGLLVYDDSLFREHPVTAQDPEIDKRRFVARTAQPLYISRLSGAVIVGPVGEN